MQRDKVFRQSRLSFEMCAFREPCIIWYRPALRSARCRQDIQTFRAIEISPKEFDYITRIFYNISKIIVIV